MRRQAPRKGPWLSRFVRVDRGYKTPCDEWTGATTDGYGVVRIDGRRHRVHRLVWTMLRGDPGSLFVLHHCDNRRCARLDHLFLGTSAVNQADMKQKQRSTYGDRHPNCRLTPEQVQAIRSSPETGRAIAARFGVSPQHVSDIRRFRRWAHL